MSEDPTAEWLAEIRAGETPWRTDRPRTEPSGEPVDAAPEKWTRKAARIAGQATPYAQSALLIGWLAAAAYDDWGSTMDGSS
jgi:hypothetical protein